ncbi:MAG: annexin [Raineya sp.]|jgi:hypothetical protein|nr:annexin [Raineya sp.]
MEMDNKKMIIGIVVALLIVVAIFMYNKRKKETQARKTAMLLGEQANASNASNLDEAVGQTKGIEGYKPTAERLAYRLFAAMDGIGTDEKAIYEVFSGKTKSQIATIKLIFDEKYGKGESLENWLKDDLSISEYNKVMSIINSAV